MLKEAEPRIRQFYMDHRKPADIAAATGLAVIAVDAVVSAIR